MHLPFVQTKAFLLALTALQLVSSDETPLETPRDGSVIGHLFPACNGQRVGGHKPLTVPVDRCLTTPGFGLQIQSAAVCANGTRAQLARFPDSKCGYGTLNEMYGLIPVPDSDLGKCLSTGSIGDGDDKIGSVSFWCEGVKKSEPGNDEEEKEPEDEDHSKKGSVSESACMPGRAPFFDHPKTDTCVNLRTSKMKVFSAGVCANGTQSTLALYEEKACVGGPTTFLDIKEENTKSCMDLEGISSYAFYCTGEGIEGSLLNPGPGQPKQSGNIWHFLLVLSLICLMFFLMLVLSIFAWIRKYGGSAGKLIQLVQGFWKPKDGTIAL